MSADKYPSIFLRQMEAIVYLSLVRFSSVIFFVMKHNTQSLACKLASIYAQMKLKAFCLAITREPDCDNNMRTSDPRKRGRWDSPLESFKYRDLGRQEFWIMLNIRIELLHSLVCRVLHSLSLCSLATENFIICILFAFSSSIRTL